MRHIHAANTFNPLTPHIRNINTILTVYRAYFMSFKGIYDNMIVRSYAGVSGFSLFNEETYLVPVPSHNMMEETQ